MTTKQVRMLTVGHSSHAVEYFASMLQKHGVTAVADVRSTPYSHFTPQFNREALKPALLASGLQYVFLGQELGARSTDPACYENGRVRYQRLARTEGFAEGVRRLLTGAASERIALMCTEKDPLDCHRTVLVAQSLVERGVAIDHVLGDGRLESHEEAMLRLLARFNLPHAELLRSTDELIEIALARQEERIAYVDTALAQAAGG